MKRSLEMQDEGSQKALQGLLNADQHLYPGVRDKCLTMVLSRLNQACCVIGDPRKDDLNHGSPI